MKFKIIPKHFVEKSTPERRLIVFLLFVILALIVGFTHNSENTLLKYGSPSAIIFYIIAFITHFPDVIPFKIMKMKNDTQE